MWREANVGVMLPQAKEYLQQPEATGDQEQIIQYNIGF